MNKFDEQIAKAFPLVAFATNRHLMNHMRRLSKDLEMDLDTTFIWGTLAHLNLAKSFGSAKHSSELVSPKGKVLAVIEPISLSSLSQVTGFARETVRRKLNRLEKSGKAIRNKEGEWSITERSSTPEIYEFTKESVRLLLESARQVQEILDTHK